MEKPDETRWGIEVKNRWRLVEFGGYDQREPEDTDEDEIKASELRDLSKQVAKYAETGQLDRIFIATQNPRPLMDGFNTTGSVLDVSFPEAFGSAEYTDEEYTVEIIDYPGFIQTPVLPPSAVEYLSPRYPRDRPLCDATRPTEILDHGQLLSDGSSASMTFSSEREPDVAHACWEAFPVAVREGVVPNPKGTKPLRPDVIGFTGVPTSHRVYREGPEKVGHIVGIEAKASVSQTVIDELSDYVESGGLTNLYLAVPDAEAKQAVELIESADGPASAAGVVSTSGPAGGTTVHRQPETLELEVGGIYVGKDDSRMSEIGWGRAWSQPD